jgi:hypothetical protein
VFNFWNFPFLSAEFRKAVRAECGVPKKLIGDDELDEVFAIIDEDQVRKIRKRLFCDAILK